jgi:NAD(P)-dependent dehydrogenase (short-subunit alcohol dehydrogenase family)
VLITGGAQGLGLELAALLYSNHFEYINLIIVDIRDDLFEGSEKYIKKM